MQEIASLTDLLREMMRRQRMTAPQLAAASRVNLRTLNSYLQGARGKRGIPPETAQALFAALGVKATDLAHAMAQFALGNSIRIREDDGFFSGNFGDPPLPPRAFRTMMHEVEREAHRLGATLEDMDYVRATLADPDTMVQLLEDMTLDRALTEEEQLEELEALRDELLAWVRRRVELRAKRRRRG